MNSWAARIGRFILSIAPASRRVPLEYAFSRRAGKLDAVLSSLDVVLGRKGRAIDAGANTGAYTFAFSQMFDAVEAFEPQPWCARTLADFARANGRVRAHRFGLSDAARRAEFFVPLVAGRFHTHLATGLGSLAHPPAGATRRITIDLVPLDAFAFDDVAVIKIDVEGHERDVLAGARATIARCAPVLIVEIEQRHLPAGCAIESVFDSIANAGYAGWFVRDGAFVTVSEFRTERDQAPHVGHVARGERAPDYVNNFVFTPHSVRGATAARELFASGMFPVTLTPSRDQHAVRELT